MKKHLIYKITNTQDNKMYIGQFSGSDKKWKSYFGSGILIKRIYKKYGKNSLIKEIIVNKINSQEEADRLEKYYIKKYETEYPNGYNLTSGGKHPKYTRKQKYTCTRNKKIGDSHKIPIYQFDLYGNFIKKHNSLMEAKQELNLCDTSISKAASGHTLSAGGFIWCKHTSEISNKIKRINKSGCHKQVFCFNHKTKNWYMFDTVKKASVYIGRHFSTVYKKLWKGGGWINGYYVNYSKQHDVPVINILNNDN